MNPEIYGNKMWFDVTDDSQKFAVYVRAEQFADFVNLLDRYGLNYYAYSVDKDGKTVCKVSFNRNDLNTVEELTGQQLGEKVKSVSRREPYTSIIGNTSYGMVRNKSYIKKSDRQDAEYSVETAERDILLKTAEQLDKQGIKFSGKVYDTHTTLTYNRNDKQTVEAIYNSIIDKRKEIKNVIAAKKELDVLENAAQTENTVSIVRDDLSYEELSVIAPLLNNYEDFKYTAAAKKDSISFTVDKADTDRLNSAIDKAAADFRFLVLKYDLLDNGFSNEQLDNLDFDTLGRIFVKLNIDSDTLLFELNPRYTDIQNFTISELLYKMYSEKTSQEILLEGSKYTKEINDLKKDYDLEIKLNEYLAQHEFNEEQEKVIREIADKEKDIIAVHQEIDESYSPNEIRKLYELYRSALEGNAGKGIEKINDFFDEHFRNRFLSEEDKAFQELLKENEERKAKKKQDGIQFSIGSSEHPAFYDRELNGRYTDLSFALGNKLLGVLDEKQHREQEDESKGVGWYKKTDFEITAVVGGEDFHYEGRFDIGDGEGDLIAHVKNYYDYCLSPNCPFIPEWKRQGEDYYNEQMESLRWGRDVFIPFLEQHTELTPEDEKLLAEIMATEADWNRKAEDKEQPSDLQLEQKPAKEIPGSFQNEPVKMPESETETENYKITNDSFADGAKSVRYQNNIAAIQTLKKIEAENRAASPDEQAILAKYVGWGGLSEAFDERRPQSEELKNLLTDEEYKSARASTLDSFYTSPEIIDGIYAALEKFGFKGGNILDSNETSLIQGVHMK